MDFKIDIEEHNILDNPIIKHLYPDLTVIKKELLHDYDQEPEVEQSASKDASIVKSENLSDNNCLSLEENIDEGHDEGDDGDEHKSVQHQGNKIILGSKSSKNRPDRNVYNTMVTVTNIKPYLDSCKRYCGICTILFPNEESFKNHKYFYHSHLITNDHQITNNPESEESQVPKSIQKNKCNICKKIFSGLSSLYKHERNIHGIRKKCFKTRILTKRNQTININVNVPKPASCFHCNVIFTNKQSLIEHLYDTLGTKNTNIIRNNEKDSLHNQNLFKHIEHSMLEKNEKQDKVDIEKVGKEIDQNAIPSSKDPVIFVYRCRICSYSFVNTKFFSLHLLTKHNIKEKALPEKVLYDPKCRFCSSVFPKVVSLNSHIQKAHKKLFLAKISMKTTKNTTKFSNHVTKSENDISIKTNLNKEDFSHTKRSEENHVNGILKSALFKCNRCDIHFLNSQVALDHVTHMEMLIHWKCLMCKHIFKKKDEIDHREQHLVTDDFTIYDICESTPSFILYQCRKCNVHFEEKKFLEHFPVCETVTLNIVKCKFCCILIERNDISLHNNYHQLGNVRSTDFIIVKTDVIPRNSMTEESSKIQHDDLTIAGKELRTRKVVYNPENILENNELLKIYYCHNCKCFVNVTTIVKHKSSRCLDEVKPVVCVMCGLIYPVKNTSSHLRLHGKNKDLSLRDFEFYNLKNEKLINPPIPEFPHCKICEVYFPRLNDISKHCCGAEEFIACFKCKLNFSELGYKLHMNYHNYNLNNCESITHTETIPEKSNTLVLNLQRNNIIYTCKHCNISLSNYDLVVEHCQEHFSPNDIKGSTDVCNICNLVFDAKCYKDHEEIHLRDINKNNLKIIEFDTFGFKSNYIAWIKKLFKSLPRELMQNIIDMSIYKDENKIKMHVIQEGTGDVTLFKCDICNCFIDPQAMIKHLGSDCRQLRNHTCKICLLPFVSPGYKIKHKEIHKKPFKGLKSYRIVLFNRKEDETLNSALHTENCFTLYKCSQCTGIVNKNERIDHVCNKKDLKVCTQCGLFIYSKDFNLHLSKHKIMETFVSKNIKIIVFEQTDEIKNNKKRGKRRGKNIMLNSALRGANRNDFDDTNSTQSDCDLAGASNTNKKTRPTSVIQKEVSGNTNPVQEKLEKLYSCPCGLHFLDRETVSLHHNTCNTKQKNVSRQQCSKCGLSFKPNILFKHFKKHHDNEDVKYKFDVIEIYKENGKNKS